MLRNLFLTLVFLGAPVVFAQSDNSSSTPLPADPAVAQPTTTAVDAGQMVAPQSEAPMPTKSVERVEVTGSHIKRIDVEGPSPVETITRKDMDKTGYNSVSDVLRDNSTSSFGGTKEQSGSNAAGLADVDVHGLGADNTLVLLDGQRLPTDAVTGTVDLNMIPMAAVERVDVLKDGASAVYGSDALGGVVNVITRKDFTGSEVSILQTQPEAKGGTKREVSLVNGVNRDRFNMVNTVQYRKNDVIYSRDRDWTSHGTSVSSPQGTYYNADTGVSHAGPACPANMIQSTPDGGTTCQFRFTDYSTELPALEQLGLLSSVNYDMSSRVTLHSRLGVTQRKVNWSFAPAAGPLTIPAAIASHAGPGGTALPGAAPGKDLDVSYRLLDLGTRDADVTTLGYNALLGSTVHLGHDWDVEVTGSLNDINQKDKGVNGYADTQKLMNLINTGQYRPFDPANKGSLESTRYNPEEDTESLLTSGEIKTSGPVVETPSGPIALAVGSIVTFQKYSDSYDAKSVAGDVFGNAGSSGGGQRNMTAFYSELSVPVTKKLEFQLAGRFDHYSDFGETTNPKVALLYHASDSVLLRASAGTGFRAPLMQELYAATGDGYQTFIDHVMCDKQRAAGGPTPACSAQQQHVISGGNPGLKEQKTISYNVGAVYEPNKDFNIGSDLFLTKMNNVVGISYEDMTRAEASGIDVTKSGVTVVRRPNGAIDTITAPLLNLSSREIYGTDLNASYRIHKVKLFTEHTQMFWYKDEGFPGVGMRNKLGENGMPPWRNTVGIAYDPNEHHDINLTALTIAEQEKADKEQGDLPRYTSVDVQYNYDSKSWGVITAGVKNLLGSTPPLDETNPTAELNTDIYDGIGRQIYAGYKTTF